MAGLGGMAGLAPLGSDTERTLVTIVNHSVRCLYALYTMNNFHANLFRRTRLELRSSEDEIDVVDDFAVKQHRTVCLVTLATE